MLTRRNTYQRWFSRHSLSFCWSKIERKSFSFTDRDSVTRFVTLVFHDYNPSGPFNYRLNCFRIWYFVGILAFSKKTSRSHWHRWVRFCSVIDTAKSKLSVSLTARSKTLRNHRHCKDIVAKSKPYSKILNHVNHWPLVRGVKSRDTVHLIRLIFRLNWTHNCLLLYELGSTYVCVIFSTSCILFPLI